MDNRTGKAEYYLGIADAVLVGEALMRAADKKAALARLRGIRP